MRRLICLSLRPKASPSLACDRARFRNRFSFLFTEKGGRLPRSPQAPSVPGQGHRNALGLLPHAFLLLMAKLFRHLLDKSHIRSCAAQQPAWHRRQYRIWPFGKMPYWRRNNAQAGVAGFAPCATRVAPAPLHRPVLPKGLSPTLRYRLSAKTFCASPVSWFLFSTVRGGRQVFCIHFLPGP